MKIKLFLLVNSVMLISILAGCNSSRFIEKDEYNDIKENDVVSVWQHDGKYIDKINVQQSFLSDTLLQIFDQSSAHYEFPIKNIEDVLVYRQYHNSRIDLAFTTFSMFHSSQENIYKNGSYTLIDNSSKTTIIGLMIMYRYKVNIFSTLECGVSCGFFDEAADLGGSVIGIDLKQYLYRDFFIEASAKFIGNGGSTYSPNLNYGYSLYSVGIGKQIIGSLGLSFNISKPSKNLVGYANIVNGVRIEKNYLDSVLSINVSYNF